MSHLITYAGINRQVSAVSPSASILDVSIAHQIPHVHECGGHGNCTTCRVRVLDGNQHLSPPSILEETTSRGRKWDPSIRLACQTRPRGDVRLQRLIWSIAEVNQLQKELAPEGRAEERDIAILFCDLRNFTKLSSATLTFDLAYMLNRFYTALGEPILMNNGIIYQYVGDEIVGVFGTQGGSREKNCTDAVRAALGMQYALDHLNKIELKDFQVSLQSGIGINFGTAFLGHLGHPTHRQFSVIGDPVNVASRIQSQTKPTQSKILIADAVADAIGLGKLQLGRTFHPELAGKEGRQTLHELLRFQEMDLQLELQSTLHLLLNDEDEFAKIFYDKVFEMAPGVKQLFKNNMIDQGRLLTHMLGGIVYTLSRPHHLHTGLRKLGQNHHRYGVKAHHFPVVKAAMMHTIATVLQLEAPARPLLAWSSALDLVIDAMLNWEKM
ncbi:MAG: adenylate/guanylate cyclase domain-containing protein [Bacteroidota bacterium]